MSNVNPNFRSDHSIVMTYEVVPASMKFLPDYLLYMEDCSNGGIDHYDQALDNAEASLQSVIDAAHGYNLPEGWQAYETYFAVDGTRILGAIRLRLSDNDFIRTHIGHIGYETRPSERGKGVAKAPLNYVVSTQLTKRALVTCDLDNLASVKVIASVPHMKVGNQEAPEHRNPEVQKFYVDPPLSKVSKDRREN